MSKLYLIVGVLVSLVIFGMYEYNSGYKQRDFEMQAEIAQKNDEARAKEQELNRQLAENTSKLQEAHNAINQKQSALDRAISAGRVRFPSAGCVQAGSGSAPSAGGGNTPNGESDRETLRLIAEIVAQGDRNTEQLNACITAYNAVREQVNGQR